MLQEGDFIDIIDAPFLCIVLTYWQVIWVENLFTKIVIIETIDRRTARPFTTAGSI